MKCEQGATADRRARGAAPAELCVVQHINSIDKVFANRFF